MGIYGMMRTGVAGMNAQANRLTGVADNVANSSTTGYKRTDTQFSSLVMPSTRNSYQSGGVTTHVRHDISMPGAGRGTGRPGDIMIDGNGFFRVQDAAGAEYLTRAGSFQRDGDGYLQNAAGFYLLDENGKRIEIKGGAGELMHGEPTSYVNVNSNFRADETIIQRNPAAPATPVEFDPKNAKSYSQKKSVTVYDTQGAAVNLDVFFTKIDNNKWEMNIGYTDYSQKPAVYKTEQLPNLEFGTDGTLAVGTTNPNITLPGVNGGSFTFTMNLVGNITQLGSNYAFEMTQDGYAPGSYKDFSFGTNGEVMVNYSNGKSIQYGVIGLATVTSPDTLTTISGTVFQVNPDSGAQLFGHPGEGTFGQLRIGTLEESNADLGDELTDMIEAQRNYTANSKVFQTGSEVMDVIVNLKR